MNVNDTALDTNSYRLLSDHDDRDLDTGLFQEAKFEIISSEASYLRSLNVLVSQFANSTKLRHNSAVISAEDWAAVFSNIYQVRECSEKFLQSLETCWQR